jgi:hypothetical protein
MNSYIYTFIREDIPHAQKIVQLGHACHEAGKMLNPDEHRTPPNLILLSAKDEDDLIDIANRIDCFGIDFHMFHEPDVNRETGEQMGHSALCTRPIKSDRERSFFRQWDLYRHTD